jgi:hypothetical protein
MDRRLGIEAAREVGLIRCPKCGGQSKVETVTEDEVSITYTTEFCDLCVEGVVSDEQSRGWWRKQPATA